MPKTFNNFGIYKQKIIRIVVLTGICLFPLIGAGCSSEATKTPEAKYNNSYFEGTSSAVSTDEDNIIDRTDAISDHWDDISDNLSGTETIEACSGESGNCYDLDAEISSGHVEEIYFPKGGYLYFYAGIDESGNASDTDDDGNSWDFTLNMDSSIVDAAIEEWADDNHYTVE